MGARGRTRPGRNGSARDDRYRIYVAKTLRAVAYGALSGFLVLYLNRDVGYPLFESLVITSLTLVGAAAWNLAALPVIEERYGRRRTLWAFGGLFTLSAAALFLSAHPVVVVAAVLMGGVAATTADNGPLATLDQAILPSTVRVADRTGAFAWYNLLASFAAAAGALLLSVPGALDPRSIPLLPAAPHPWILLIFLLLAAGTLWMYLGLSPEVELSEPEKKETSAALSPATQRYTRDLTVLFGIDAFAGGLIVNPLITTFFASQFGTDPAVIGAILFLTGTASALSYLAAGALAARFGLLETMVFTHLPSNVLLALVPLMPTFGLALGVLIARSALSQMDVPTRQTYTMNLVSRRERVRVAGRLGGARAVAQSGSPFVSAAFQLGGLFAVPFVLAGGLKIAYDLTIWRRFRRVPVPGSRAGSMGDAEEEPTSGPSPPRG